MDGQSITTIVVGIATIVIPLVVHIGIALFYYGRFSGRVEGLLSATNAKVEAVNTNLDKHIATNTEEHARIDKDLEAQANMLHDHAGQIGYIKGHLNLAD